MSTDESVTLSNTMRRHTESDLRMMAADVQHLVREAKAGNGTAFRHLVERYMKPTYNLAFSFVNDHHSAEDVTQEVFIRVYQSLPSFRGDAEFSTWLYRITVNLALNRSKQINRRAEREQSSLAFSELSAGNDHEKMLATDYSRHIERALHELPTLQRAVVILRHLNGLSTKQVSTILQCSEGTVKTHLHRGLKRLRSTLKFLAEDLAS
jgi:RNA polymerase sigma-70 factor (ECF subfamily)